MNIFRISKIASHLTIAMVIALVLLASSFAVRADDNNNKKKDSAAQSKPAKSSKTPPSSTGGKSSSSTSGGDTGGKHKTDNSGGTGTSGSSGRTRGSGSTGGTSTTGNSGGSSVSGNSGHKHADSNTGATNTTSTTGGTSTNDNAGRKHGGNKTGSGNATGASGGNSTTGDSGASQKPGKPGKTHTTDATAASGGTSSTTTSVKGNKHEKTATEGTSGATSTTTTNVKGNKHDNANATGGTGGTTSGKSGKVTTTNLQPGLTRSSNGKPEVYRGRDGSEARFRHDGTIREVHTRDMTIIHRPGGSRTVIVERPDRSRIVVNRFGHGYVQRPFLYRGHEFAHRTYFYRGQPYALYYRGYAYRGVTLHGYVPYRYYSPAFYGWAYRPWYRPVRYSWGWGGSPWYGYYGRYYFTPYAAYPSASFWLTDYLISASLQAAYEERLANQSYYSSGPSGAVMLSPEVKDQISNEVQRQLALENSESRVAVNGDLDMNSSGLPRMLAETSPSNPRIFVVAGSLDVTDNQGQDCTLTEGDVLRLSTPPAPDATAAFLQVLATKNQSCAKGSMVSVSFEDLQEMQNHMRATIDRGLQDLQSHQGGLPVPPANAAAAPVQASFAPIAPPPDANASSELQQQARAADAADREVLNEVNQADNSGAASGASSTQPDEISLGQTIGEVEAILGKPKQIVNLGAKKMYIYPSMKITFVDGKVSDVQ
jgi:hypothetical protein